MSRVKQPRRADRVSRVRQEGGAGGMPAIGMEAEFTTVVDDVAHHCHCEGNRYKYQRRSHHRRHPLL